MSKLYRNRNGELKELMAHEPNPVDKKPVIYDATDDTYKTTDSIDIEEGNFSTVITDELYVNGTAHINNTEEHDVEGNYLTLRANQNTALANGTYSGIIINHYNTNGDLLVLVTDNTGTLRVGTGTGTNTTYTDLYYANSKYYTDSTLTTEVEPSGVMTSWDTYETTDTYEHWTNAVWTTISFTTAEPLLTRSEAVSMVDKSLLRWDATNNCAATIAAPTCDESTLAYDATNCCYYWQEKQPGSLIFDTVADYNAYAATTNVPNGTAVYIRCESGYLIGDDQ